MAGVNSYVELLIPCDCKAQPNTNHNPDVLQKGRSDKDRAAVGEWDK